jgi:hypothetical protein
MAVIYAIQIVGPGHPIKIGVAKTLITRLDGYRSHNPYPFKLLGFTHPLSDAFAVEREIKSALSEFRLRGREWFHPAPQVVACLSGILVNHPSVLPTISNGRQLEPRHLRLVATGKAA